MAIGMISAATTQAGAPTTPSPVPSEMPAASRQETPTPQPLSPVTGTRTDLPDDRAVQDAVETINDGLVRPPLEAQYSVNENAGITIIKIVNTDSGEVLRQIPNEKAVILAEAIKARLTEELHLVDEKA